MNEWKGTEVKRKEGGAAGRGDIRNRYVSQQLWKMASRRRKLVREVREAESNAMGRLNAQ